ncbi:hypothetical protein PM082_007071 [Marasmius tenuissimus]|nr:hypothetical protein PM082_007071 [Marasmius tenuissimus]
MQPVFIEWVSNFIFSSLARQLSNRTNRVVFGKSLVSTMGEHHRKQRKMLNPVFSSAHMRDMVPIFHNVANKVVAALVALRAHDYG